jgi:arylformamidase
MSAGESSNVSLLTLGSHTGTHVDPPRHMIQDGDTVDNMPLDVLVGECFVCSMMNTDVINAELLEDACIPDGVKRILFKTKNSVYWSDAEFHRDYTYLAPDAAEWLVSRGIQLVGIDYLSVEQFHSGHHKAHLELLNAKTIIIEGLDLSLIQQGIYKLICLPLKILEGDGSPARTILIDMK